MSGRIYTLSIDAVALASTQVDIFSIQSTANMAFRCKQIILDACDTAVTLWTLTLKRFSGAYSIGSGGSSVTLRPANFGDAAATATGRVADTTKTTSGTSVTLGGGRMNLVNGWTWQPGSDDDFFIIAPSQALVLVQGTTPASQTIGGTVTVEEIF